jgi:adenylate cyclase class 2
MEESMALEVEQKFHVTDEPRLREAIAQLNPNRLGVKVQRDVYYNHPARDFAQTDEALRLRTVGEFAVVTYKGPKLSGPTKTRREIELPLQSIAGWEELLEALGFRRTAEVSKEREAWELMRGGFRAEICCDHVEGLGTFAEIEIVATPDQLSRAQEQVTTLAAELGLQQPEHRSYLEMVLSKPS